MLNMGQNEKSTFILSSVPQARNTLKVILFLTFTLLQVPSLKAGSFRTIPDSCCGLLTPVNSEVDRVLIDNFFGLQQLQKADLDITRLWYLSLKEKVIFWNKHDVPKADDEIEHLFRQTNQLMLPNTLLGDEEMDLQFRATHLELQEFSSADEEILHQFLQLHAME